LHWRDFHPLDHQLASLHYLVQSVHALLSCPILASYSRAGITIGQINALCAEMLWEAVPSGQSDVELRKRRYRNVASRNPRANPSPLAGKQQRTS
jgi:hypothetical protein